MKREVAQIFVVVKLTQEPFIVDISYVWCHTRHFSHLPLKYEIVRDTRLLGGFIAVHTCASKHPEIRTNKTWTPLTSTAVSSFRELNWTRPVARERVPLPSGRRRPSREYIQSSNYTKQEFFSTWRLSFNDLRTGKRSEGFRSVSRIFCIFDIAIKHYY